MNVCEKIVNSKPCKIEPIDKEWGVGFSTKEGEISPFPRVNKLLDNVHSTKFSVDHERACLITEAYKQHANKPQIIKSAEAFAHIVRNVTIRIYSEELIVGEIAAPMKSSPIFPEFSFNWIVDEIKNHPWEEREVDPYFASNETKERLLELEEYWKGKTLEETMLSMLPESASKGSNVGRGVYFLNLYMYGGIGHTSANYEKLFQQGYKGIKKRVEEKIAALDLTLAEDLKKREFYLAQLTILDASKDFINRYAQLAKDMADNEESDKRKEELLKISEVCEWVSENPPRTFNEALQLAHFATCFILIESNGHSISYGRFDQYMYPYYSKDLETGTATREEMQELIECFFIKFLTPTKLRDRITVEANSSRQMGGQSLTLGGVDSRGRDVTNDLTFMALDAHAHTRLIDPWLAVRLHANTPRELKVKLANIIRIGTGQPKVYNDESAIPAMLTKGASLEDSRNYHVVGCVEIDAGGKEYGWHDAIYFSVAKIMELSINGGRCLGCSEQCPRWEVCAGAGKKLGPDTGNLKDFKSFDEVKESYDKQMKYWVDQMTIANEIMDIVHQRLKPVPYLSLIIDDCIEKGLDVSAGGAKYNFTGPQGVGIGTVADSLCTIKQLVFEENKVSGEELMKALENNWEGYEPLYALVNSDKVHHYGNDDDYADELAQFAFNCYCDHVENRPNARGGKYIPGVYSVSGNVPFGMIQWASPDGRKAFEPLSDCLGAVHTYVGSHDINGPTAMCKSVAKLDHERAANGTLLNWKFTPSSLVGETGRDNFIALLDEIVINKIHHSQFNIVSKEMLESAQQNPEAYKHLLVRVAGYSAYFVELSKALQNDIVGRTEFSFE